MWAQIKSYQIYGDGEGDGLAVSNPREARVKISLLLSHSILSSLAKQYIDFKLRMSGIVAYGASRVHSL